MGMKAKSHTVQLTSTFLKTMVEFILLIVIICYSKAAHLLNKMLNFETLLILYFNVRGHNNDQQFNAFSILSIVIEAVFISSITFISTIDNYTCMSVISEMSVYQMRLFS
jgi:hypothetical protein